MFQINRFFQNHIITMYSYFYRTHTRYQLNNVKCFHVYTNIRVCHFNTQKINSFKHIWPFSDNSYFPYLHDKTYTTLSYTNYTHIFKVLITRSCRNIANFLQLQKDVSFRHIVYTFLIV